MTKSALALLLCALAVGSPPALAAEKPAEPAAAAAPLWSKRCVAEGGGPEICYVEQYAIAMPGNKVLLNVMLGFTGADGAPRLMMTAPLGVRLLPGLVMAIDGGRPITLPFESCQAGGCRMVAALDQTSFEQIRRGTRMTVRFVSGDGSPLDIPVPLTGLAAALRQLKP